MLSVATLTKKREACLVRFSYGGGHFHGKTCVFRWKKFVLKLYHRSLCIMQLHNPYASRVSHIVFLLQSQTIVFNRNVI